MGEQASQLIAWSLEAPRPSTLPCGFQIISQQLSRSQFCKSFKAQHTSLPTNFLAKVIQIPENFDAAPYVAILLSEHLSLQRMRFSLPFSYICNDKQQITLFRPLTAYVLSFGLRRNKEFMAYQMIRAVNELHDNGIVHGNIRLSNFVATEQDEVFLTDAMACKPLRVDDELEAEFFLGICDMARIESSVELFSCCTVETDLYELGLAIYELFYGDLSVRVVAEDAFQFKPEFDKAEAAQLSINAAIKELLARKRVNHASIFEDLTLIRLSNLRFYLPGSFYSDLQFLLMIGEEYLRQLNQTALLYISSHLISRIYNVQILADVELNVLNFILECYKVLDADAEKEILRLSFILLERLQMCEKTNYLLFFTRLLELIKELDAETYYFPFLVMCRFFVCSQLEKDIMIVLQSLRRDQYFDLEADKSKQQSGQFNTGIDSFYLVNCFSRMYAQLMRFSQNDINLNQVSDVLFFSHQFSFLEKLILMCHEEIEEEGADQLISTLLRGMGPASESNEYFISRVITLLNNSQKDVGATFLRFSGVSEEYLISVEELIATECRTEDFRLEIAELFIRRLELGFSGGCTLQLQFAEYLIQRISQVFFSRHELSTGMRRGTISLLCRVVALATQNDPIQAALHLNSLVLRLFTERLRIEMEHFIRSNCGVELLAYEDMPTRLEELLDDIQKIAAQNNIEINFHRGAVFAGLRALIPTELLNSEYLERFVLNALACSEQFYMACQGLVRSVQLLPPNVEYLKLSYTQQSRSEGRVEFAKYDQVPLSNYLRCYLLFPLQFERQTTDNDVLNRLLENNNAELLGEIRNPFLGRYYFNRFLDFISCTREYPLSTDELESRITRLRRGAEECNDVVLSSSNRNCFLGEDLYQQLEVHLIQMFSLMRQAEVKVLCPEKHVMQLSEHESWMFYRETIENQFLEHRVFAHLYECKFAEITPQMRRLHHTRQFEWYIEECSCVKQVEMDGDWIYCLTNENIMHVLRVLQTQTASDILRFIASAHNTSMMRVFETGTSYRDGNRNYSTVRREIHSHNFSIQCTFEDLIMNQYYDSPAISVAFPFNVRCFHVEEGILNLLTDSELLTLKLNIVNLQLNYVDAFEHRPRIADQYSFVLSQCKDTRFNLFLSPSERLSQLVPPRSTGSMGVLQNQLAARYNSTRESDMRCFRNTSDAYCSHCDDLPTYLVCQEYIVGRSHELVPEAFLQSFELFNLVSNVVLHASFFTFRKGIFYAVSQHHVRAYCEGILLRELEIVVGIKNASFEADLMYLISSSSIVIVNYELQTLRILETPSCVSSTYTFEMESLRQYSETCDCVVPENRFMALLTQVEVIIMSSNFKEVLRVQVDGCQPSSAVALGDHILFGFSHDIIVQVDLSGKILNCEVLRPTRSEINNCAAVMQGKYSYEKRTVDIIIEQASVFVRPRVAFNGIGRIICLLPYAGGVLSANSSGHLFLWK